MGCNTVGTKRWGETSECDETHLGMNAGPFISLFSGIHSQRLMERADKEERMKKKSADMNVPAGRGRERRSEEEEEERIKEEGEEGCKGWGKYIEGKK